MNHHSRFVDMLAVRADLSVDDAVALSEHLAGCADCSHLAGVYVRQDGILRRATQASPPAAIRHGVSRAVRVPSEPGWRSWQRSWQRSWRLPLATVTILLLIGVTVTTVLWPRGATPVRASVVTMLRRLVASSTTSQPNTGSSTVSYNEAVFAGNMPLQSQTYTFPHRLTVRWAIRDVRHYRIEATTELPAIQAGTVTYIRNGETLLVYDHRSEEALRQDLTAEDRDPPVRDLLQETPAGFELGRLLNGGTWSGPYPDPTVSIRQYLVSLRGSPFEEPLHPAEYARIVGSTTLLGQSVDIVDFGPLERSDYITGCSFTRPGHCLHHPTGRGYERVWVSTRHPLVLRYEQRGTGEPSSAFRPVTRMRMRVTSLHVGVGPTDHQLQYRPPASIRVEKRGTASEVSGGGNGDASTEPTPIFRPLLAVSGPNGADEPDVPAFYQFYSGPARTPAELDQVWSAGAYGPRDQVIGPYVEVQEYVQWHGLPAAWRQGVPHRAGRCTVYTGAYADGQRWLALQRAPLSIVASTNRLSTRQLVQYAATVLCTARSR